MPTDDEQEGDNGSIYDEDSREELVDGDELTAGEEGFMKGYEQADEEEEEKEEGEEEV